VLTAILPVYNADEFLEEAIRSILSQTFQDFKLWIIDDGSSDDSKKIILEYSDHPKVRIDLFDENRGKLAVITEALQAVRTKYFTVHDADDYSYPDRFEQQIALLESNDYGMVGASYISVDEMGREVSRHIMDNDFNRISLNIMTEAQFHGPTMMVRTSILAEVSGFYRIMKMGEDIDFSMRVVEKYSAVNTENILYAYRINPRSMTKSASHDLIGKLIDRHLIYAFARERSLHGADSLMRQDWSQIERLKNEAREDFEKNKPRFINEYVGYLLHYKLFNNAFNFCLKMSLKNPLNLGVHRIMLYVLKMILKKGI
jgi:glycosyltransferase involved in cell wall biosynthesis